MCIIIIKKAGIVLPERQLLQDAWNNNPDGAGYMYADNKSKSVVISKGFMTFKAFIKSITSVKNIDDLQLIIHFRITTHGGTQASNTHPFPISSSKGKLKALRLTEPIGVAHNGIINISNDKDISDTMQFIKDELSLFHAINGKWYKDVKALQYIGNRIGSKLAIMDRHGYIATIGEFYEEDGILYSNYGYMAYRAYTPVISYASALEPYHYGYDDLDDDIYYDLEMLGLVEYEIKEIRVMLSNSQIDDILIEPDAIDIFLGYIYK